MSGVTKHSWEHRSYSGNLTIVGRLTASGNKVSMGAGDSVVESNAVGTYNVFACYKEYTANGLTDYYHISKILGYQVIGANTLITDIELYVSTITAPDKIDSIKLRHVDLNTGVVTTDWEDPDDKSVVAGTIEYPDVNITLAEHCAYFLEIALDGGTTNFRIHGFGIIYDLV